MPADPAIPRAVPNAANARRETALWFAAQGFPVHPLAPGAKTPAANCARCRKDKHQAETCPCVAGGHWCHGFHAATTDPTVINLWWQQEPYFGVAVSCGPAGLVVVDVDNHSAPLPDRQRLLPGIHVDDRVNLTGLSTGYDTLALLSAYRSQPNPAQDQTTLRVRTPSGGLHIWYRTPPVGPAFRSSSGSGARTALAWQVDIRATGGYIVAPTTRTTHGTYQALPGARTPAPLPLWLNAELTRTGHARLPRKAAPCPAHGPGTARQHTDAHRILAPLLDAVRDCAHTPAGAGFSEKLNRAGFTAAGLAAGGHISEAECLGLLAEAAEAARPAQSRRNQLIIDSAFRAGSSRPIHPKGRS